MVCNRRSILKSIGAVGGVGGIAGCSGDGSSNGGGNAETTTQQNGNQTTAAGKDVGVGVFNLGIWDTSMPTFVIPQRKGFFEEEGVNVNQLDIKSGSPGIRAVLSAGSADVGQTSGVQGILSAFAAGANVRIAASGMCCGGGLLFYTKEGSQYNSIEDLNGATIGFSNPGSSTEMVLDSLIKEHDLDVELTAVGGPPDAFTAIKTGQVDVAWTVPPFFISDIRNGPYEIIFTGSDAPPFDRITMRGIYSSARWLEEGPADAYFRAMQRGLDWSYNNVDEAAQIWAEVLDRDDPDLLADVIRDYYPKEKLQLGQFTGRKEWNDIATRFGYIDQALSEEEFNTVIDTSHIP